MLSGKAIHTTPRSAIAPQSRRLTERHDAGNSASVAKPIRIRTNVTPFGPIARDASAMKRNDAPQMTPGMINSNQSSDRARFMPP